MCVSELRAWNIACAQIYDMPVHFHFECMLGIPEPGKLTILPMALGISATSMDGRAQRHTHHRETLKHARTLHHHHEHEHPAIIGEYICKGSPDSRCDYGFEFVLRI